jgi:hypothetical protein
VVDSSLITPKAGVPNGFGTGILAGPRFSNSFENGHHPRGAGFMPPLRKHGGEQITNTT